MPAQNLHNLLRASARDVAQIVLTTVFRSKSSLGLTFAIVWLRRPDAAVATLSAFAFAFLGRLPGRWLGVLNLRHTGQKMTALRRQVTGPLPRALIHDWAFPVAGTLVFAALLMQASPVLARVLDVNFDHWTAFSHALFWAGATVFVAPFLDPELPDPELPDPNTISMFAALPLGSFGLNSASVLRALFLFNLMIGVQTLTDRSILMGGAV